MIAVISARLRQAKAFCCAFTEIASGSPAAMSVNVAQVTDLTKQMAHKNHEYDRRQHP